ncbi:hypothetical protein LCGC14_2930680, partial [marine sediment metagenome]
MAGVVASTATDWNRIKLAFTKSVSSTSSAGVPGSINESMPPPGVDVTSLSYKAPIYISNVSPATGVVAPSSMSPPTNKSRYKVEVLSKIAEVANSPGARPVSHAVT